MPTMAIGDASTVLIGQAVGAGSLRTVPRVQRAALMTGLCYVGLCSLIYATCAPLLAAQFTPDADVLGRAVGLMHIAACFVWIWPLYAIGQASLRAIGDVRAASLITVIVSWGCTPLFAAWLGLGLGLGARGGFIGLAAEISLGSLAFWYRIRGRSGGAENWVRNLRRFRSELRRAGRGQPVAHDVVATSV